MVMVLLSLYSLAAIGVPTHAHYCKGELQHITLYLTKECDTHEHDEAPVVEKTSCCTGTAATHCEADIDKQTDCCDDESDLIQFEVDAVMLAGAFTPALIGQEAFDPSAIGIGSFESDCQIPRANAPPEVQTHLYLALCSLVFYE